MLLFLNLASLIYVDCLYCFYVILEVREEVISWISKTRLNKTLKNVKLFIGGPEQNLVHVMLGQEKNWHAILTITAHVSFIHLWIGDCACFFFFFLYHLQHNKLLIVSDLEHMHKMNIAFDASTTFALSFSPNFLCTFILSFHFLR